MKDKMKEQSYILTPGNKLINKQAAWRKGKNVMLSIATMSGHVRVKANDVWGKPKDRNVLPDVPESIQRPKAKQRFEK